ncbi:SNX29 family protein [Megaselia abdita]
MPENTSKREEIVKNLKQSVQKCDKFYKEVAILASETDPQVLRLCNLIQSAFFHGIKVTDSFPTTILKNVQEALDINLLPTNNNVSVESTPLYSSAFWNFCERHLIPHEKERFENLKNIWTPCGKAKAFIRSCLNESSLQRYICIFVEDEEISKYYEPWSVLLDPVSQKELIELAKILGPILFALNIDSVDLNTPNVCRYEEAPSEPVIFAPIPIKNTRKTPAVERPIATSPEFPEIHDILEKTRISQAVEEPRHFFQEGNDSLEVYGDRELPTIPVELEEDQISLFDPSLTVDSTTYEDCEEVHEEEDVSSVSSRGSSSTKNSSQPQIEMLNEKLREMTERVTLLETRVAELSLENRRLRRLTNYTNRDSGHCLVTIPYAKRVKKLHRKYYVYEVHITMPHSLEKWTVSKRYSEFYDLNEQFKKMSPNNIEFPPKKHFGNLKDEFVEERRQLLQIYIRNVLDLWPGLEKCQTREDLEEVFPFFK